VRIDHVIYGTADLDAAATRLTAQLGLAAVNGGRHDELGTRNRIVPLGDGSFLELLAIADPGQAKRSTLGAALQSAIAQGEGLLGWAVAVEDLQPVVERLGTPITHVGRQGKTARLAGLAQFLAEPCLPFFIERDTAQAAPRAVDTTGICWIEVAGDARRVRHWLGGLELPVRVVDGEPAVRAIGVGGRELRTR
jgi:catechol 2,3-dioxygenase-like lactoylglutathione lyase family enzyme